MLKNLFKQKKPLEVLDIHEADVALRLMFEIAISDGKLDKAELSLIKKRADKIIVGDEKASTIIKKIIDETNAKELSDIGKVMPLVMQRGKGKVDGKIANKWSSRLPGDILQGSK